MFFTLFDRVKMSIILEKNQRVDNDEPLSTEAGRVVQLTLDGQKLSLRLGRRRSAEQELPSGLAIPVPIVALSWYI